MKVSELIEALKKEDPDAVVVTRHVDRYGQCLSDVDEVHKISSVAMREIDVSEDDGEYWASFSGEMNSQELKMFPVKGVFI
jgi:hypothetical protein